MCQLNSPKRDNPAINTYKRYRFPAEIISYAIWLYYRFNLSHRDIEDVLAQWGIIVSREAIPSGVSNSAASTLED
jgi:transposase-like protein